MSWWESADEAEDRQHAERRYERSLYGGQPAADVCRDCGGISHQLDVYDRCPVCAYARKHGAGADR